jgi:DNA-nicking Smr family endonuclease
MGKKRPPPPPKPKEFHNTPFSTLKGVKIGEPSGARRGASPEAVPRGLPGGIEKPLPPPPPPPKKPPEPVDRTFEEEMAGVARLSPDPRGRLGAPEPTTAPRRVRQSDDAEAYAQLADLVEGVGPFDIADSDEYIEGLAPGIDKRLLRKLRKGDYALQGHLDLHGMTSEEARDEVERFVDSALGDGKRCLLIIHGRGLNSKDNIPVLKERLKVWLTRGRIGRRVLAFATARPTDGGAGAVYVLLRR